MCHLAESEDGVSCNDILDALCEFEQSPEGPGLELGLSMSELVLQRLDELGWTQKRLAEAMGKKEAFISRVVHSNVNWTRDTAGRMMHALGIRARFHRHPPIAWDAIFHGYGTTCSQARQNIQEDTTYEEDVIGLQEKATTAGRARLRAVSYYSNQFGTNTGHDQPTYSVGLG